MVGSVAYHATSSATEYVVLAAAELPGSGFSGTDLTLSPRDISVRHPIRPSSCGTRFGPPSDLPLSRAVPHPACRPVLWSACALEPLQLARQAAWCDGRCRRSACVR